MTLPWDPMCLWRNWSVGVKTSEVACVLSTLWDRREAGARLARRIWHDGMDERVSDRVSESTCGKYETRKVAVKWKCKPGKDVCSNAPPGMAEQDIAPREHSDYPTWLLNVRTLPAYKYSSSHDLKLQFIYHNYFLFFIIWCAVNPHKTIRWMTRDLLLLSSHVCGCN